MEQLKAQPEIGCLKITVKVEGKAGAVSIGHKKHDVRLEANVNYEGSCSGPNRVDNTNIGTHTSECGRRKSADPME